MHQQPARRRLGEPAGIRHQLVKQLPVARVCTAPVRDQVSECQARQRTQRAVALQPLQSHLGRFRSGAFAGHGLAELGVLQRQVQPQETGAATAGTDVSFL
jgi:hypothetical protein